MSCAASLEPTQAAASGEEIIVKMMLILSPVRIPGHIHHILSGLSGPEVS